MGVCRTFSQHTPKFQSPGENPAETGRRIRTTRSRLAEHSVYELARVTRTCAHTHESCACLPVWLTLVSMPWPTAHRTCAGTNDCNTAHTATYECTGRDSTALHSILLGRLEKLSRTVPTVPGFPPVDGKLLTRRVSTARRLDHERFQYRNYARARVAASFRAASFRAAAHRSRRKNSAWRFFPRLRNSRRRGAHREGWCGGRGRNDKTWVNFNKVRGGEEWYTAERSTAACWMRLIIGGGVKIEISLAL